MINLMKGDCLKRMKDIPDNSVDMVLTDLPYGTTNCKWDSIIDLDSMWVQLKRIIKPNTPVVMTAQTPFDKVLGASNLPMLKYEWIWEKTAATGHLNAKKMPMKAHENILVFYDKPPVYNPQKTTGHKPANVNVSVSNDKCEIYNDTKKGILKGGNTDRYPRSVIQFKSDKQKSSLHPTQKPVALGEYLIKTYSNEGDVVLDICFGSGSFGVAAVNTGRKFIGIEKNWEYFKLGKGRINGCS